MKLLFSLKGRETLIRKLEIGIFLMAAATGITLLLREWFDVPYWIAFLVAGIASAWAGGRVSGWTTVVLSTLACDYFFVPPNNSLAVDQEHIPEFVAFSVAMLAANSFGTWRKNAETAMQRAHDELSKRVQERSVQLKKVNEALQTAVSNQEAAEQERRIAELRWRAVLDNSVFGIVLADDRGQIISANLRSMNLLGVNEHQIANSRLEQWIAEPHRVSFNARFQDLIEERIERVDLELPHQTAGGLPKWLRANMVLVQESREFPRFVIALYDDVTERKQSSEALIVAQSELAHAARLTTIGEIAASIAHELNQPLSAVVINCSACLRWLESKSPNLVEAQKTIKLIMRDAKRASDVIVRIRSMVRKDASRWSSVRFNDVVRESLDMLQSEIQRQRVELATQLDAQLPAIHGERVQLQQVIINLVMNAIEAMATISDRPRRLLIKSAPQLSETPGIMLEIRDSGPGVAPGDIDKLFTAFFTTKAEGTGLGLWISHSIVENHYGKLLPISNPGHGMSFRLLLPCEPPIAKQDTSLIVGEDFVE